MISKSRRAFLKEKKKTAVLKLLVHVYVIQEKTQ